MLVLPVDVLSPLFYLLAAQGHKASRECKGSDITSAMLLRPGLRRIKDDETDAKILSWLVEQAPSSHGGTAECETPSTNIEVRPCCYKLVVG